MTDLREQLREQVAEALSRGGDPYTLKLQAYMTDLVIDALAPLLDRLRSKETAIDHLHNDVGTLTEELNRTRDRLRSAEEENERLRDMVEMLWGEIPGREKAAAPDHDRGRDA